MFPSIQRFPQPASFGWGSGGEFGRALAGKDAPGTRVTQKLTALDRTSSTDVQIQVQTDEGDTVSITLHRETDLSMISYRYRSSGQDGKQTLALQARSETTTQNIGIQVDGSLSDAEKADLEALIQRVASSLPGMANGSGTDSLPGKSESGDFASLAGYSLTVSQSETLSRIALRSREWQPASPPISTTPPAADGGPPVPVVTATPPADSGPPVPVVMALPGGSDGPTAAAPPLFTLPSGMPNSISAWMLDLLNRASESAAGPNPISLAPTDTIA
jgi:hypothetical protein